MDQGTGRYAAFLSYSHKDAAAARWLHRRLETYRIPKRLVGTQGEWGPVPARLTPIFRDREELPAAGDLSERVRAALALSDHLVILCSPHAAASPWVAKEIAAFRELHPDRPVYAAIVDGEPAQCFPPSLAAGGAEPLAADLRPGRDGRRLGFLKLVAGLSGVGLDALVQRDAQRRVRRVTAVTVAALAAMLVMAVLTGLALSERREAQRQRAEAEGLVEFMLTDLRDRLKGVGRLDVLTAVNQRALDHYRKQNLESLPPDSLARRARILHAMGEDDEKRDDFARATTEFTEAARTTAALLGRQPSDPARIYDQGQSEFWLASIEYEQGHYGAAQVGFERYRNLARRLVAIDPHNPDWLKEGGYSEGNFCSLALQEPVQVDNALRTCRASLRYLEAAAAIRPDSATLTDVANRLGWMADALAKSGQQAAALACRGRQLRLIQQLRVVDKNNASLRAKEVWSRRAIANLEAKLGQSGLASVHMAQAIAALKALIELDDERADWRDELQKMTEEYEENRKEGHSS